MNFSDYANVIPVPNIIRNAPSQAYAQNSADVKSPEQYVAGEVISPAPQAILRGFDDAGFINHLWLTNELFDTHVPIRIGRAYVIPDSVYDPLPNEKTLKATTLADVFNKRSKEARTLFYGFAYAYSQYYHKRPLEWQPPQLKDIAFARIIDGGISFVASATTTFYGRRNSNIYKNIFPDEPVDVTFIHDKMDVAITSASQIVQQNHNFATNDVVFLGDDGLYYKSQADKPETCKVSGIVKNVESIHVFTLLTNGRMKWPHQPFVDTTVLYLSDTLPGTLCHHTLIKNKVFIPVATYINDTIILNVQQGTSGASIYPYSDEQEVENFDRYTFSEINEVIQAVKWGVSE